MGHNEIKEHMSHNNSKNNAMNSLRNTISKMKNDMNDILEPMHCNGKDKEEFLSRASVSRGDKVDKHNINCNSADGKCPDSEKVMGHSSGDFAKF